VTLLGLALILFPSGRSPSPRWRTAIGVYVVAGCWWYAVYTVSMAVLKLPPVVSISAAGDYVGHQDARSDLISFLAWAVVPVLLGFWIAFVTHQVRSWRAAAGERREQLKWLMAGGAVSLLSVCVTSASNPDNLRPVTDVAALGIAALPLSIGVGILKYRLYEIDRLVSRTISYAIVTGVLVATFVGVVALTTGVLPFSSPVGVTASTLAAAALFNPLRLRVQRVVDRRFNRARYDADLAVEAFASRLRHAVDPEAVQVALAGAVDDAVEPATLSIWIRASG
jgi:hypothetical protein